MSMPFAHELRRHAKQVVVPVLGIASLAYFAYHAIQGDRGLFAWMALNQQLKQTHALADAVAAQRHELENRVQRLSSNSLDPDLLDERVRSMLNLARHDDVVIMLPTADTSSTNAATSN
jgi:cell division protein FtsB